MPGLTYAPAYPQGWRNKPDTSTPLDADALQHFDAALASLFARTLTVDPGTKGAGTFRIGDASTTYDGVLTREAADAIYDLPTAVVTGGQFPGISDATAEIHAASAKLRTAGGGRMVFINKARYVGTPSQAKAANQGLRGAVGFLGMSNTWVVGAHSGAELIMDNLNAGQGTTHAVYFVGSGDNVGVRDLKVRWASRPGGRGLGDAFRFTGYPGYVDPTTANPDAVWGWAAWTTPVLGVVLNLNGSTSLQLSVGVNGGAQSTTGSIVTMTAAGIQAALEALPNLGVGKVTVTASTVAGLFRVVFTKSPSVTVAASAGGTAPASVTPGMAGVSTGTLTRPFLINTTSQDAPGVGAIFMGCERIKVSNHTTTDTFADGLHFNACRIGTVTGYTYTNSHKGHGNGDDSLPFVTYYDPLAPALTPEGPFNQPALGDWSNDGIVAEGFSIHGGRASGIRVTGCRNVTCSGGKISGKGVGIMVNGTLANTTLVVGAATSVTLQLTDNAGTVWPTAPITDLSVTGITNALAGISYIGSTDNVDVVDQGGGKFTITIDPDVPGGGNVGIASSIPASSATLTATNSWSTSASTAIAISDITVDNCSTGVSVQSSVDQTGTEAFWHFDVNFKDIRVTRSKTIPWNLLATSGTAAASIYGIKIDDCTGDVDALLGCVGSNLTIMRGHVRNFTQSNLNGATSNLTIQGQASASTGLSAQMTHRLLLENVMASGGGSLTIKNINDLTLQGRVGSRDANVGGVTVTNCQRIRGRGELVALTWNRANNAAKAAAGVTLTRVKDVSGVLRILLENDTNDVSSAYNSLAIGLGNASDPAIDNVHMDVEYRTTMDPAAHTTGDDVAIQTGNFAGDGLPTMREWSARVRYMHRGGAAAPAWIGGDYANTSVTMKGLISRGAPSTTRPLKAGIGSDATDQVGAAYYSAQTAGTWTVQASGAPLNSPAFTGSPTAPTPSSVDVSTKLATTAFVAGAITTEATARANADALKATLGSKFPAAQATNTTADTTLATSSLIPASALSTATVLRLAAHGNVDAIAASGTFNVKVKVNGISLGSLLVAASQTGAGTVLTWDFYGEIYVDATGVSGSAIWMGTRNQRTAAAAVNTSPDQLSASTVDLSAGLTVTLVASMATANAGNILRLLRGHVSQVA